MKQHGKVSKQAILNDFEEEIINNSKKLKKENEELRKAGLYKKGQLPVIWREIQSVPDYKTFFESYMDQDEFNANTYTKGLFTQHQFIFSRDKEDKPLTQFKTFAVEDESMVVVVKDFASYNEDEKNELISGQKSVSSRSKSLANSIPGLTNDDNDDDDDDDNDDDSDTIEISLNENKPALYKKGNLIAFKQKNQIFPLPNEAPLRFLKTSPSYSSLSKIPNMPFAEDRRSDYFWKTMNYMEKKGNEIITMYEDDQKKKD